MPNVLLRPSVIFLESPNNYRKARPLGALSDSETDAARGSRDRAATHPAAMPPPGAFRHAPPARPNGASPALNPRVPFPISDETRGPRSNLSSSTNVSNRRGRPRDDEASPDASARLASTPSHPSRTIAAPTRARALTDRQSPRLTPVLPIIPSTTKQVPRPRGQAGSTLPARAHPRWSQARPRPARPR